MIDIEFGKLIEKLIHFSGQKNYSLAKELGYDVSYISKWISSTMLPTSKNIKNICGKVSVFIVENTNESSLDDIIDYLQIEIQNNESKHEELKVHIEEKLNNAYRLSKNKKDQGDNLKKQYLNKNTNSCIYVNPRFKKKIMDGDITNFINEEDFGDVIIVGDLFALNKDDKMHIAGIRRGASLGIQMQKVKMRFLINFSNDIDDIIFNTMLFINMMTIYSTIDFSLYSCQSSPYSLMVAVKDKIFHNTMYIDTQKCLFINTSQDKNVVEDIYYSLEEMINTRSRLTFLEKNPELMILEKNYMQYIIDNDLKWLIGNMNELFMPSDLFLEIGKEVFGYSKEIIEELKKIDAILQNATYNMDIKVLMYESGIRQYISTGELSFFNVPITISFKQRQRHIEYIEKLIKEKDNIDIRLIDGNLVEDFKHVKNPSLYVSKNLSFLKIDNDENNRYLIVRDVRLEKIFKKFFEDVYKDKEEKITKTRKDVIDRISDSLMYAKILNNTDI